MFKNKSLSIFFFCAFLPFTPKLQGQILDSNKPPGGNFNLTNYYLGLPVDSSGGTNGDSASISASQLVSGYTTNYFYTGPDGAMTFWAFCLGATTSGSSFPRSELREQISSGSNSSNWVAYGTHILNAQCKVTQVPSTGKVIIGQIHGYTGSALPLVKLQYNNGTLEGLIKTNADNDLTDKKYTFGTVGLSNLITYQIKVVDGLVSLAMNGSTQSLNVFVSDPHWATNTLYFKAGSYCQDNTATNTDEGARIAFYSLSRSHAPSITNQPASRSAILGSNTTFSVSAAGNGPLRYQWRFNDTNNLSNATNSTLTLTNLQSTNAGGYSVRVTDSLGVVTSIVASLTILLPPAITTQPTNATVIAGINATFSIVATGTAPLSYQWYFNTNILLTSATNATLLITNVDITRAGFYSVVVTNIAGSVSSTFATLTVDRPPVPGSYATVTGQAVPISTPTSNLLAVASDPDGDALSLTSVNPTSANGGSVTLSNTLVWFAPIPSFVGTDQWSYVLSDALGASATGIVSVSVISSNSITLSSIAQHMSGDGTFSASFQGSPGLRYTVDRATNVEGPWEIGYTGLTADANGTFELSDPNIPPQPIRFYRTRYP